MTNEELQAKLNAMDPIERELTIAADDAQDALMAYKIGKKYGVEVVCNPDGDRTKVSIDGVVMNQEQFATWLMGKELEEYGRQMAEGATEGDEEDYEDEEDEEDDVE